MCNLNCQKKKKKIKNNPWIKNDRVIMTGSPRESGKLCNCFVPGSSPLSVVSLAGVAVPLISVLRPPAHLPVLPCCALVHYGVV